MSASRRSRSSEDPSRAIWERRQREKERVRARIENERRHIKAMSQYGKLKKQAEWKRKLAASPFAVDQLAEHERIDEENRIRLLEEQRRQQMMEKRKEAIKTQIIVKALSEASDIESLRAEKRAIQLEERRLKALLEIERVKQHKKADHQAAVRAEQVRHREKKEFRKDKFSVLQQQRQNTLREAKMAKEGLVDDPTTGRAVPIMSKEGEYAVKFLRKAGRLPPYVDRYIAMRKEREIAIDPDLGPVRMPPAVADRATGQAMAAEIAAGYGYEQQMPHPGLAGAGAGLPSGAEAGVSAGGAPPGYGYGSMGYAGDQVQPGSYGPGPVHGQMQGPGQYDAAALAAGADPSGYGMGPGPSGGAVGYAGQGSEGAPFESDGSAGMMGMGMGMGMGSGSGMRAGEGSSRGVLAAAVEEADEEEEGDEDEYDGDDGERDADGDGDGGQRQDQEAEEEDGEYGDDEFESGSPVKRATSGVSGGDVEDGGYEDDDFELSQTGTGLPSMGGERGQDRGSGAGTDHDGGSREGGGGKSEANEDGYGDDDFEG